MAGAFPNDNKLRKFDSGKASTKTGASGNNTLEPVSAPKKVGKAVNPLEAKPAVSSPKGTGATLATTRKSEVVKATMPNEDDYQAESDVRTLHAAHQIRQNPTRHMRAKAKVKSMMKAMGRTPQMAANAGDAAGPDSELPQN